MKKLLSAVLVLVLLFALCGCSKKHSVSVKYEGAQVVQLVDFDKQPDGLGVQINKVIFDVHQDGTYHINITVDGQPVMLTATLANGTCAVVDDSDLEPVITID